MKVPILNIIDLCDMIYGETRYEFNGYVYDDFDYANIERIKYNEWY